MWAPTYPVAPVTRTWLGGDSSRLVARGYKRTHRGAEDIILQIGVDVEAEVVLAYSTRCVHRYILQGYDPHLPTMTELAVVSRSRIPWFRIPGRSSVLLWGNCGS